MLFYRILFVSLLFISTSLLGQKSVLDVIPHVKPLFNAGKEFVVKDTLYIYHQPKNKENGDYLKFLINKYFPKQFVVIQGEFRSYLDHESPVEMNIMEEPRIMLHLDEKEDRTEFYHLESEEGAIAIEGGRIGLKRGMNTLIQLLATENNCYEFLPIEQMQINPYNIIRARRAVGEDVDSNWFDKISSTLSLQPMIIEDFPKYAHRGMLLDCCRHFFSVETVKKYLDLMALYKMNTLHWHLTEDQGWRIQIDKYPKLTEVGAWRIEKDGSKYGGFYTKEEIREIVKYADERGITVIPEIELPGHSQAAIASYPHLSCTGEQYDVVNDWGVFKEIYCAGNDSVFTFLEDVLTEVIELFPSKYIHIGGDEAPKYRWEHCSKCQKRIKDEGLKDEHELQSYFIKRIEKFLKKNGRDLIGWDEILEGGLSATATVQSWRGFDGGMEAARHGNKVVMSPTSHCYFDYDLKSIDLKRVWEFDPMPEGLEESYQNNILGGECNLWSERIPDEANLDSKVFPRMMAMAEVLWGKDHKAGYEEFYNRVQKHYPMLKAMNVRYGLETTPARIESFVKDGEIYATMISELPNVTYKYRWDSEDMELDGDYSEYQDMKLDTFLVKDWKLTVKVYKNGKQYGEPVEQFFKKHKAIGAKIRFKDKYSSYYPASGDQALVDGRTGTIEFRDGNWQGFWGKDVDIELDLGKIKEFSTVIIRFNEYQNSWIFRPKSLKIQISKDGKDWEWFCDKSFGETSPNTNKHVFIQFGKAPIDVKKARYIRVLVENYGKVPDWHEAAGQDCWLFLDEIMVE